MPHWINLSRQFMIKMDSSLSLANQSNITYTEIANSLVRRPKSMEIQFNKSETADLMATSDCLSPRPVDQHEVFVLNERGIVDVYANVHISFLRNINTTQQSFECTIIATFEWHEKKRCPDLHLDECWRPEVSFSNAASDMNICYQKLTRIEAADDIWQMNFCIIVNGTFAEHFELKQFPLDAQRLHINMTLMNCPILRNQSLDMHRESNSGHRNSNNTDQLAYKLYINDSIDTKQERPFRLLRGDVSFAAENFMDFDSWKIIEYVNMLRSKSNPAFNPSGLSLCKLIIYVTVQRKCEHYFWNIIFPLSLQVCLAHTTFFIANSDIGTKTQITLTIILTIFAVKFTCMQYLPVVNQITYLDMYFIYCTFFVGLVTVQNLVAYLFDGNFENGFTNIFNIISGALLIFSWLSSNAFIYCLMLSRRIRERFIRIEVEENDDAVTHDQYVLYDDQANVKSIIDRANQYIDVDVGDRIHSNKPIKQIKLTHTTSSKSYNATNFPPSL